MESLKFTFETERSYIEARASGRVYSEPFNIVRFVIEHPAGYTSDFPVKSREDALKTAVKLQENGVKLLNVYECVHMEENKFIYQFD